MSTNKKKLHVESLGKYDQTVVDYVTEQGGYFLVFSDDAVFTNVLRASLHRHLGIEQDAMQHVANPEHMIKAVTETAKRRKSMVVFIDRVLHDKEAAFAVRQIKNAFPQAKVVVLTGEAERSQLVLLHEVGADNFIIKPVSSNTLIEKIAFTIKPQTKLGKLIDQGKAMVGKNDFENAMKVARKILDMKPNSAAAFLVMGDAYRGLGKPAKAAEAYMEASDNAHMYLEPLKKLAELHKEAGDYKAHLRYLEKLDQLSPLNAERKVDMGEAHLELGNGDQAEDMFQAAVKQAAREAAMHIELVSSKIGNIYTDRNPAKAEEYYRKALAAKGKLLDASDIKTFNLLGMALRKQGKWREAIEEYKRALEISPGDENLFYNMAMALAEGKQFNDAYNALAQAESLNQDFCRLDPVICHNAAMVSAQVGRVDRAKRLLQTALDLNPDFESARKMLAKLGG